MKIHATDREGITHEIEGRPGDSLMVTLRDTGRLPVAAICGGCCSCATCHVFVAEDWAGRLGEPDVDELDLVEFADHYVEGRSRLSCQITLDDSMDGLAVTLAPEE